jgi:AcrR family transcriptional regulator
MAKKTVQRDKKEKLLEAAVKLFVKKGYENTSLKDLAKAVGIQAPGVYYYFKSKKDILNELADISWQRYREMVIDEVRAVSDPEEQVRTLIRQMIIFQFKMGDQSLLFDDPIPVVRTLPKYRQYAAEAQSFRQNLVRDFAESKGLDERINISVLTFTLFQLVRGVRIRLEFYEGFNVEDAINHITCFFFHGCYGFKPNIGTKSASSPRTT